MVATISIIAATVLYSCESYHHAAHTFVLVRTYHMYILYTICVQHQSYDTLYLLARQVRSR